MYEYLLDQPVAGFTKGNGMVIALTPAEVESAEPLPYDIDTPEGIAADDAAGHVRTLVTMRSGRQHEVREDYIFVMRILDRVRTGLKPGDL